MVLLFLLLLLLLPFAGSTSATLDLMGSPSSWYVVVDGVMGGKSAATLTPGVDGTTGQPFMTFSGAVNFDGGGFASIRRYLSSPLDLRPYAGILVQYDMRDPSASTGGQTPLAMRVSMRPSSSSYAFGAAFGVPAASSAADAAGRTGEAFIPLAAFYHGIGPRGRSCDSCAYEGRFASVGEIDLYNLFQEGRFSVRVRSITAVMSPRPSSVWTDPGLDRRLAQPGAVSAEIRATIDRGATVYDKGYPYMCAAVYAETARSMVKASTSVDPVSRRVLCGALSLDLSSDADIAWGLRRAFDAVLNVMNVMAGGGSVAEAEAAVAAQDPAQYPLAVRGAWPYEGGVAGANCSQATGQPTNWNATQQPVRSGGGNGREGASTTSYRTFPMKTGGSVAGRRAGAAASGVAMLVAAWATASRE